MKTSLFLLCPLIAFSNYLWAQQSGSDMPKDTVQIEEITVTQNFILNDENMVKYYQSSHSSGIDKMNARLGGVSLISRGAYAREPVLNGFSGGQINVTIGGMKMFGACTDKMDPITSYIEPINLKSVRLNQGTTGNKSGSTVGGAFDMELQQPEKSAFNLETGARYETVSTGKTGFLLLNYGQEQWAYRVSGVYKHFLPYAGGDGKTVPFTQYGKINLLQSFLYSPASRHRFIFDWLIDDAFDIGYPALPMDVSRAKGRMYSLEFASGKRMLNISNLKAKVYCNSVFHLMDDSQRDSLYFVKSSKTGKLDSVYMKMDMPGWTRTSGAFAEGDIRWSEKNLFSFKLESYSNWSKAEMTMFMNNLSNPGEPPMFAETWPENRRWVSGVFIKNDYVLSPKTMVSADFRADYSSSVILSEQGRQQFNSLGYPVDRNFQKIVKSGNLMVAHSLQRFWQLKAGVGWGERLPTLSEQFGFYLFNALDGYDYLGNPHIKPEQSYSFFVHLNYSQARFKFSAEARYNHINNYILGLNDPGFEALNLYASGIKKYENIDFARLFSANVQFLWEPFQWLEFFNVMKYNWGETFANRPLPLIPPLKNLFSVHVEGKNFNVQAETEYSAPQNRINKNFGETETPGFFLLHFKTGYKIKAGPSVIHLNAGIENILDKVYSEHLDWGNYNRPGRNFYLSVSYKH
ncbi:TonB-dependent receptor [Mariniphaga sediminis]|jgi:iron complex outermembrane receptor protein|uniref:TonB-dependent receptor n=1 Tax=Mariniphaga sediminis TaxID=1628158 RepID=A0A399D0U9_9BACT|nr:TonB-dependent receptor [Mariniphaga sediminis]RIH65056.1 TonB-dependent receptor [Mariniphaga sediminis]